MTLTLDDLDPTEGQRTLYQLATSIPPGRWCSYGDLGDAMAEVLGTGSARGAASAEDSLRRRVAIARGHDPDASSRIDALGPELGYPWHRVRGDDGRLVHGGVGRQRRVIADPDSTGNVRLRDEGGEIVGGGYASQRTRFDIAATVRDPLVEADPLCTTCFIRPCQCE